MDPQNNPANNPPNNPPNTPPSNPPQEKRQVFVVIARRLEPPLRDTNPFVGMLLPNGGPNRLREGTDTPHGIGDRDTGNGNLDPDITDPARSHAIAPEEGGGGDSGGEGDSGASGGKIDPPLTLDSIGGITISNYK